VAMQAADFASDEFGTKRMRPTGTDIPDDHTRLVEEALGEQRRLVWQAENDVKSVWHGVIAHTRDRHGMLIIWTVEVMWLFFVVMANSIEIWGSCPLNAGMASVCWYCYDRLFLAWSCVFVIIWGLNLYTYVLLLSKGFSFRFRGIQRTVAENKGLSTFGISFFVYLSVILFFWAAAGIVILACSTGACNRGNGIYTDHAEHHRSRLMFNTVLISVIATPILLILGRFDFEYFD
jgi:hypothetical protein